MRRRSSTEIVLVVAASMALCGAARADSDGYYCAGQGYLAYQWNGISVPTSGHVLRIVALDGRDEEPDEVSLESFQVHGMKCSAERVELRGWNAIYSVVLSKERQGVFEGKRFFDELDAPGFTLSNLANYSVAGVDRRDRLARDRQSAGRLRRAAGMQPLPMPVKGGALDTLRSFLNVHSDADFVLVVAWALACLCNRRPYPVIVLAGEQGSAKSTFSAILRLLLDPNTAPLCALPREDRDLFIAASNGHVLAFDNVSGLRA